MKAGKILRLLVISACALSTWSIAQSGFASDDAYKIGSKKVSVKNLYKDYQGKFFDIEKQKYELIENLAKEEYLNTYFEDMGKSKNLSVEEARNKFLDEKTQVSDAEIKDAMGKFKDHPKLKDLSEKERRLQVVDYLKSVKSRDAIDQIVSDGLSSKKLVILYPEPKEPRYTLTVVPTDPIKFGPNPEDNKPAGCNNDCPITIIEYSEYQCPFCARVQPTSERILKEYKGKVRWIVRDFPLGFHNRARPAAIAARCAQEQGKYWQMYNELFKNQRALADENLKQYGKNIGLDQKKFESCLKTPGDKVAIIDKNYESGEQMGVTGTPAFFINGRRLSGAVPYENFKEVIDEELSGGKSKS